MKVSALLLLGFLSGSVFAQLNNSEAAMTLFQQNYNTEDVDAVFDLFNESMQEAVNIETTGKIISSLYAQYGELKTLTLHRKEASVHHYEGHFQRGKLLISISVDESEKISGLIFKPIEAAPIDAKMERNKTKLLLPFRGKWFTIWGGDTKAQNYHVIDRAQRHAFDFLIIGKGNKTYERSGTRNEDYFAFGQPIFAICDAEVVDVTTGVRDNKPGEMNPSEPLGNCVILKTEHNEFIVYAHFEYGTVNVKKGDFVSAGQLLGRCGNSGNSSEAHLHLHIQDGPDIYSSVGVKCYFDSVYVNGSPQVDYSP